MSDIAFGTFDQIEVTCSNFNIHGSDLTLDHPARRKPGGARLRRALVHDESDGLTINFDNDYDGGVTINGPITTRDFKLRGGITMNGAITINGGITMSRNLSLTGDVQFQIQHFNEIGDILSIPPPTETVGLAEIIKSLRSDIRALQTRIATLEARP